MSFSLTDGVVHKRSQCNFHFSLCSGIRKAPFRPWFLSYHPSTTILDVFYEHPPQTTPKFRILMREKEFIKLNRNFDEWRKVKLWQIMIEICLIDENEAVELFTGQLRWGNCVISDDFSQLINYWLHTHQHIQKLF